MKRPMLWRIKRDFVAVLCRVISALIRSDHFDHDTRLLTATMGWPYDERKTVERWGPRLERL
jgi:hypothetical protein